MPKEKMAYISCWFSIPINSCRKFCLYEIKWNLALKDIGKKKKKEKDRRKRRRKKRRKRHYFCYLTKITYVGTY